MANILTNAGRAILSARLIGSGTEPRQMGFGSGAGTAAAADTTLFAEKAADGTTTTGTRVAGTSSQVTTTVTNDTYQVLGTLTATAAWSVTNAGLFDNATIGSGSLFIKSDFAASGLNSGDQLQLTFKTQF